MTTRDLVGSGILALGIALGGVFVGSGFAKARTADRYVTVKGISEREVRADLAIWPLGRKTSTPRAEAAGRQRRSERNAISSIQGTFPQ